MNRCSICNQGIIWCVSGNCITGKEEQLKKISTIIPDGIKLFLKGSKEEKEFKEKEYAEYLRLKAKYE